MDASQLPELVLHRISLFLGFEDIINLSKTCHRLRTVLPKFSKVIFNRAQVSGRKCSPGSEHPFFYIDGPKLEGKVKSLKISMRLANVSGADSEGRLSLPVSYKAQRLHALKRLVAVKGEKDVWLQLMRGEQVIAECHHTFRVSPRNYLDLEEDVSKEEGVTQAGEGDVLRFITNAYSGSTRIYVKDFALHLVTLKRNCNA